MGHIGRSVCSPETSALETARLLRLNPISDERLRDQAFGDWAGRDLASVESSWPGQLQQWIEHASFRPPGGESFEDVAARVRDWAGSLEDVDGNTVVVASAGVIRAAICTMLKSPDLAFARSFDIEPFGRAILTTDGRRWKLRFER